MKFTGTMAILALLGQVYAGCTQVADATGNSMTEVEKCPVERDSAGVPTGRYLCAGANAWITQGGNWGATVYTTNQAVTFRIVPLAETGTFEPVYYSCTDSTDGQFVWTRDYSVGVSGASLVV